MAPAVSLLQGSRGPARACQRNKERQGLREATWNKLCLRQEREKSWPAVTLFFSTKREVDQRSELRSNVAKRVETETGTLGPGAAPSVSKPFPSLPAYTLCHKSLLPWAVSLRKAASPQKYKYGNYNKVVFKLGILSSNNFQLDASSVTSHNNKCSHSVLGTSLSQYPLWEFAGLHCSFTLTPIDVRGAVTGKAVSDF